MPINLQRCSTLDLSVFLPESMSHNAAHADEIGREMLSSGLCTDFVEKVLVRAKYYEGVYDLMVLWSEENTLEERERIIIDLTEEIQEE